MTAPERGMRPEGGLVPAGAEATQALAAAPKPQLRLVRATALEPSVPLTESERAAYLRRFSLLFADDATRRQGGLGSVVRVSNAQGEVFALKTLLAADGDATPGASLVSAFREEYECHRSLSGLRGFPRLYAWCEVDGAPAIVMEWVEGMTLASAARLLAVDGAGRLSPLMAARVGRDLVDLVCRMALVGSGIVHRDISPANVMVRTSYLSLEKQVEEGQFDLCLIDFGSSSALDAATGAPTPACSGAGSFTEAHATLRRATVAYAAPEMLTDDLPGLLALRRSPAIDVYAAASVVYELVAGHAPFAGVEGASPYRIKVDNAAPAPVSAHGGEASLVDVLPREPEVALAAAEAAQQLSLAPDSPELRDALAFVDEQLAQILLACLASEQKARPEARDVHRALEAFGEHYLENVGRSLRGEPLSAGPLGGREALGRTALLAAGQAVALIVWVAAIASAAALARGAEVSFAAVGAVWEGAVSQLLVAVLLAAPGVVANVVRWRPVASRRAFVRGTAALVVCEGLLAALLALTTFSQAEVARGVGAAALLTAAATWFSFALAYALLQPTVGPTRALPAAGHRAGSLAANAGAKELGVADEVADGVCAEAPVSVGDGDVIQASEATIPMAPPAAPDQERPAGATGLDGPAEDAAETTPVQPTQAPTDAPAPTEHEEAEDDD